MRAFVRRFVIFLGLVLLLASGPSSALAISVEVGDALSESEYWDLVEESRTIVSGLRGSGQAEIALELTALARQWDAVDSVTLDSGEVIGLDNSYLVLTLSAEEPDVQAIASIFEALWAAHEDYQSGVFTIQDVEPLHGILARPEFQRQEARPNPLREWFNRFLNKLLEWLGKLSGNDGIAIGIPPEVTYTLSVIILVLVLFFVFRSLFVDFITEARLAEENIAEELLTSESAFQKAQALSRGGDYRAAVRFLYLSSLLLLDERGLLRYDRSKTNREYLRSISNSPELHKPLSEVIEVFDDVWYGYHSLDEDTFKHYSQRVEELKEKKG